MYSSPHYTIPPGYVPYNDYNTPRTSPHPGGTPDYYPQYVYTTPPRPTTKRHARNASHDPNVYNYSSPPRYYTSPGYGQPGYYPAGATEYATPKRPTEHVSRSQHKSHRSKGHESHSRSYRVVYDYDDEGYETDQARRESPRYPSDRGANRYQNHQVPTYAEADTTPRRSRARRSSHSTKPTAPPKMPRAATAGPPKPAPKATEEDALRAGIPAGYSYKNWDPTEEPVMLLGSVFDSNSLGKWIYDWTVYHHGPATPMSGIAGDLWLLLIQLAGKVKRADECLPRIRRRDNVEMVEDFLEGGERLWTRLKKLLKACEEYMWKAAERKTAKGKAVSMGKNSGCEFVDSIFGRDRELENTEKLMTGMRLWSMRFDANCEEILRRPTA
ncbi:MAG: hypothetical protein M1814_006458 [Vezdaea aestivalis]|nr:MAG: hypothetical protein M1814_006458 [Vezdaea aestivalis]